ncbi:hypothetical protein [Asticcacaulis sp. YBE204]|uniref:hypothetical protein n=1 Tax=Asticcacaulis sp. YBE204 TaxID=1282363 RepID=UPI0012DFD2B7|nr:hypothetical protein [Asticcacaulis sp. YBE204]
MNDKLAKLRHFDFSSLVLGNGPARYLIVAALPLVFYLMSMWAMQAQINQMQQQIMQPMMPQQGFQQQQPGF